MEKQTKNLISVPMSTILKLLQEKKFIPLNQKIIDVGNDSKDLLILTESDTMSDIVLNIKLVDLHLGVRATVRICRALAPLKHDKITLGDILQLSIEDLEKINGWGKSSSNGLLGALERLEKEYNIPLKMKVC